MRRPSARDHQISPFYMLCFSSCVLLVIGIVMNAGVRYWVQGSPREIAPSITTDPPVHITTLWELLSTASRFDGRSVIVEAGIICPSGQGCFLVPGAAEVMLEPHEETTVDMNDLRKRCHLRPCTLRMEGDFVYSSSGSTLFVWRTSGAP